METDLPQKHIYLYKYLTVAELTDVMKEGGLRAKIPQDSETLMEFMPAADSFLSEKMNSAEYRRLAIVDFSESAESPTMWGVQADRGKGVCLVFAFPLLQPNVGPNKELEYFSLKGPLGASLRKYEIIYRVKYDKKRYQMKAQLKRFDEEMCQNLLARNTSELQHKREWRFIGEIATMDEVKVSSKAGEATQVIWKYPMRYLEGIILGPKCSLSEYAVSKQLRESLDASVEWSNAWEQEHPEYGKGVNEVEKEERLRTVKSQYDKEYFRIVHTPDKCWKKAETIAPIETHNNLIQDTKKKGDSGWTLLYMYFTIEGFEGLLSTWSLKSCFSHTVNDPMENMMNSEDEMRRGQFQDSKNSPLPYFCFSRRMSSPVMWGNYADKGKGICLVFAFPLRLGEWDSVKYFSIKEDSFSREKIAGALDSALFFPVNYTDKIATFNSKSQRDIINSFTKVICTKSTDWSYEDEIRCLSDYEHASSAKGEMLFYSWPMRYLAGAIVGPHCDMPPSFIQRKLEFAYKQHIANSPNVLPHFISEIGLDPFIVTKARFHDNHYSIESAPWCDYLEGENIQLLYNFACYIGKIVDPRNTMRPTIPDALECPWERWCELLGIVSPQEEAKSEPTKTEKAIIQGFWDSLANSPSSATTE